MAKAQGTVIILDIGRNVATSDEKETKSFFEDARECAARIIERKIMSQGNNVLGVILLGSKTTKNNMADQVPGAFKRIELLHELQEPSWQMIRSLPDSPSNSRGDWIEAIIVAADHYQNGYFGKKLANKKIVLMTNFQYPTQSDSKDIEQVLNGLKDDGFEVDVIGPDLVSKDLNSKDIELARKFVQTTDGATAPFEHTMQYLLFHRKRVVNSSPWNVDLSIGPNVKIPVSAYIRLENKPVVKNWSKAIKDPVTKTASSSETIIKNKIHYNNENQTPVEPVNVIKGYNYGHQIIPFNECDKTMQYESGEKCLSVYGFTHASIVKWGNMSGEGLYYIFGRKGVKKAQLAVQCLVQCLHELKLVGIVRRVYNKGNAPKMYALMPVIDTNGFICLSMASVCFKDEIKNMAFPSINQKKFACTEEQVNAFKDLIHAMDLTKAYDDTYDEAEAFPIAETVSPSAQYILDCIAFRAMNPGKPLPQPRDDIMMLFKQPPLIEKRSRDPIEKLKKLFTLNKVEIKTKSKKKMDPQIQIDNVPVKPMDNGPVASVSNNVDDTPKINLPKKINEVMRIGTVNPIDDYKALIAKDKKLADLASELAEAIESLIYCNLDGKYSKGLDVMKFFREECVKNDPSHYNNWLQKFKAALGDRNKSDVLSLIIERQLGVIVKAENPSSAYESADSHDDSQAYEMDTIPNTTQLTIESDVKDMFDEM